jgi:hypothetical protein
LSDYINSIQAYSPLNEHINLKDIIVDKQVAYTLGDYYPIPHSEESEIRIKRYLEKHRDVPYLPYETIDLSPVELNQLNYIILSLDGFYAQKNKMHVKREHLIPLIMSKDGCKKLKRERLKSFLTTHNSSLIEEPDWWKETPSRFIEDIGEVYNYSYCMFWEAEDEQDYLLSQLPVQTSELREKFIKFINGVIGRFDDFEEIKQDEILFKVSSSKALNSRNESVPNFSIKNSHMSFSEKRSFGKRVLITTAPGQGRDAIINKIEDLNTIQLINENIRMCLEENFPNFILTGNVENSKRRFFKRCRKSLGFYCRDIKKEGITKPKWIIKEILKALHNRFPENVGFHYTDFYDGPWFEGDKGDRGHGLGMANELTTLMQILIYLFTNKVIGKEGEYVSSEKAFFLNDDAVIFFKTDDQEAIDTFADYDFYVCNELGIMAQKDKSFTSRTCCVFCEMYYSKIYRTMNDKESYILREQNVILRSGSLLEAKFLLGNMKGSLDTIENLLKKVFSKLGYEFSKRELNWPLLFGGMRPTKLRGTDFALLEIGNEKSLKTLWNAYNANLVKRLWKFDKLVKNFKHPILMFYPSLLKEEPILLQKLGITNDFELSCMFFRPTKERKFHSSIEKLRRKRAKIFEINEDPPLEEDFYSHIVSKSFNNMALPEKYIERYIPVKQFIIKNFKDPYKIKNPITAYLNHLGLRKEKEIPSTDWGLFSTDASLLTEKSVFARNRTLNTLSLIDRFEEDIDIQILVFPENKQDIADFMEAYPKPFLTNELIKNGNKLPIPKKNFWNPELTRRRSVFGKYLEYHHIVLAQRHSWLELAFITKFEQNNSDEDFDINFWDEVFDKVTQKRQKEESRSKSSSSSSYNSDDDSPFGKKLATIDPAEMKLIISDLLFKQEPVKEEILKSSESSSSIEEEEVDPQKDNPFLIKNGPLKEGDLTEYGSIGWVQWLVQQDPITIENYMAEDPDLDWTCSEMLKFKVGIQSTSNIMEEHNEVLKRLLDSSRKWSWISQYFYEWIHTEDAEDEDLEIDLFG